MYWGLKILGPDNDTTRSVRKAFETSVIEFATEPVMGAFQSYGYPSKPGDTLIEVGPKKPPSEP